MKKKGVSEAKRVMTVIRNKIGINKRDHFKIKEGMEEDEVVAKTIITIDEMIIGIIAVIRDLTETNQDLKNTSVNQVI